MPVTDGVLAEVPAEEHGFPVRRMPCREVDEPAVDVLDLRAERLDLLDAAGERRRRLGNGVLESLDSAWVETSAVACDRELHHAELLLVKAEFAATREHPFDERAHRSERLVRLVRREVLHPQAIGWLDTYHVIVRFLRVALVLVAVTLLAAACGERGEPTGELPPPYPVTARGAGDTPVELAEQPQRIIALDPGSAELVDALGAGDRLVGVPTGVTLEGGRRAEEVVKPTEQIDVEAVAKLDPDLIVATLDTDRVAVSQVERRTGASVYIQPSRSIDDVLQAVIELGFLVGQPVEARQLKAALEEAVSGVEQRVDDAAPATAFVDRGFFITVSDNSLLGDLIDRAKGTNVAGDGAGLGPFPLEELQAADPDVYLVTSDSGVTLESLRRKPETKELAAVRGGRVVALPVELVMLAGPHVAEALEAVAVALHPDAFR